MRKINTRKLRDELACILEAVFGIILLFCNITKTVPGVETTLKFAMTEFIAYGGFFLGIFLIIAGIFGFLEVRNKKYSRKKTRK